MSLPNDYIERVYAGVLGKLIGVYLGRPFEGWSYESIMEHLGEINYYVHEKLNVPLIVTDDDISGTFTFVRALQDYDYNRDLTPAQIGHTWLNYLIEEQTILWWGGMGNSTEHTAYLRLKEGIEAPRSGSIELNGKVVAEQIGSQIFIDGWAMIAPGDPELAADFARRAGSVSHDGEAIYGAQVLAAMEAQAFVEPDLDVLIDTGVSFIPKDSVIYRMINDIREWHVEIQDWREGRELLAKNYGYDTYGGNCHMVPNHGLMILSMLYGEDDFQKSQMIVNTSGWDTDCNAGNIGCLMGIKNGLAGLAVGPDWRGPVADRLYLPTADGGRAISDAVTETIHLVNTGRALQGLDPVTPKDGAKFHFDLPGSVQGFMNEDSVEARDTLSIHNVNGHSESGSLVLALNYQGLAAGRVGRVETPTFVPSSDVSSYFDKRGYRLLASPTLYAGQTIKARVVADKDNDLGVGVTVYIKHYNETDELSMICSEETALEAGDSTVIEWKIPDTNGNPIAQVGIQISGTQGANGTVYLDYLTWDGAPDIVLDRPFKKDYTRVGRSKKTATMWKKAWINGLDTRERLTELDFWPETYRLIQNVGRGLFMQGTREWTDYQVTATMTPHMCKAGGLGVHAQGMKRYYAMLVSSDKTQLVATVEGKDTVLTEVDGGWEFGTEYKLSVKVEGNKLSGYIDDKLVVEATDADNQLTGGGIALIAEVGRIGCEHVEVRPV
jgi:hypothetical protein